MAFFLWSAFRTVDLRSVWRILLDTDAIWLFGSVALIILATYPRAFRWRILMAPVLTGIPTGKLFLAILIGYAGNNLIPRSGEIAKIWAVDREPARMSGLIATVAVERLIDLLSLLVMFAGATYVIRDRLEQVFPWMAGMATTVIGFIVLATTILIVISVFGQRFLDQVARRYQKIADSRIVELARGFLRGTESIRSPAGYAGIIVWTILLNVLYAGAMYLPFLAFGFHERYGLGFFDALVILTIATIGIIIPTPGGTGTYHYFCSRALSGLYDIPLEESVAFATVVHGLIYVTFLVLGGPGLISLLWNKRRQDQGG
jgi:uncharacterized protein (TIRG00374 family)